MGVKIFKVQPQKTEPEIEPSSLFLRGIDEGDGTLSFDIDINGSANVIGNALYYAMQSTPGLSDLVGVALAAYLKDKANGNSDEFDRLLKASRKLDQ